MNILLSIIIFTVLFLFYFYFWSNTCIGEHKKLILKALQKKSLLFRSDL